MVPKGGLLARHNTADEGLCVWRGIVTSTTNRLCVHSVQRLYSWTTVKSSQRTGQVAVCCESMLLAAAMSHSALSVDGWRTIKNVFFYTGIYLFHH